MKKTNKELQKAYREKMKATDHVWVGYWISRKLKERADKFIKQLKKGK